MAGSQASILSCFSPQSRGPSASAASLTPRSDGIMDAHQVNSRALHDEPPADGACDDAAAPGSGGRDGNDNGADGAQHQHQHQQQGSDLEKRPTRVSTASYEETYPEGGLEAWLVVLGAWFAMMSSMGLMNTIAIFQAYTLSHQLAGHSESTVGWIFSIYTFLAFFCGVYIGPVFDKYGPRWLVVAGCASTVAGVVATSFCEGESQTVAAHALPTLC